MPRAVRQLTNAASSAFREGACHSHDHGASATSVSDAVTQNSHSRLGTELHAPLSSPGPGAGAGEAAAAALGGAARPAPGRTLTPAREALPGGAGVMLRGFPPSGGAGPAGPSGPHARRPAGPRTRAAAAAAGLPHPQAAETRNRRAQLAVHTLPNRSVTRRGAGRQQSDFLFVCLLKLRETISNVHNNDRNALTAANLTGSQRSRFLRLGPGPSATPPHPPRAAARTTLRGLCPREERAASDRPCAPGP